MSLLKYNQNFRIVTLVSSETGSMTTAMPWQPWGRSGNQQRRWQTDRWWGQTHTERWGDKGMTRGFMEGDRHDAHWRIWYRWKSGKEVKQSNNNNIIYRAIKDPSLGSYQGLVVPRRSKVVIWPTAENLCKQMLYTALSIIVFNFHRMIADMVLNPFHTGSPCLATWV